jgi:hypothetical protein
LKSVDVPLALPMNGVVPAGAWSDIQVTLVSNRVPV